MQASGRTGRRWAAWWSLGLIVAMAILLSAMGRRFWCECGSWVPWSWDIWTSHNSQHLIDPYFFSHVLHGVLFCFALRLVPRWDSSTRFVIAVLLEVGWEILENSPLIIQRYRESTMAVGYTGDSIANSITDVVACTLGFLFATHYSWKASIGLLLATEVLMLVTIRDSLLLNIVMLVTPIPAIQQWQTG